MALRLPEPYYLQHFLGVGKGSPERAPRGVQFTPVPRDSPGASQDAPKSPPPRAPHRGLVYVAKETESDVAPNRLLAALLHRSRFDLACDSPLEFILGLSRQCRWDFGPNRFWTSVLHRSRFDSACVFAELIRGMFRKCQWDVGSNRFWTSVFHRSMLTKVITLGG